MRILLAEDDELLGDGVKKGLRQQGYVVDWFKDGLEACRAIENEQVDLIILDLGLPKKDGFAVLDHIRKLGHTVPILILTARDTISDLVQCLDLGADDYLTKPFDLDELYARIRALHRRSVHRPENILVHGDLVVDPASHAVSLAGQEISIPRREFSLLQKLLENVGHVLSRDQLTQSLYSWEDEIDSNALEVHIHNLRKKLGNNLIRTIRGVGYLIAKVEQDD